MYWKIGAQANGTGLLLTALNTQLLPLVYRTRALREIDLTWLFLDAPVPYAYAGFLAKQLLTFEPSSPSSTEKEAWIKEEAEVSWFPSEKGLITLIEEKLTFSGHLVM